LEPAQNRLSGILRFWRFLRPAVLSHQLAECARGPGKLTPCSDQAIRAEVRRDPDIAKAKDGGRDFEVFYIEGGWFDTPAIAGCSAISKPRRNIQINNLPNLVDLGSKRYFLCKNIDSEPIVYQSC